jgi:aspartate racemase
VAEGADFGLLAANTTYIVFDSVRQLSPFPLINIVDETCQKAQEINLHCVALFGTKFTMQGGFYDQVFSERGI